MKAKHCIPFLLLSSCFFVHQGARAQKNAEALNIRGDTLYLSLKNSVAIVFPSALVKADIYGPDGSYEVDDAGKNSLSIKALKGGAGDQMLQVVEGNRNHLFILSYKDGSPPHRLDVSNKKKLGAYAMEKRKNVSKALQKADDLFKKAVSNSSDETLWESVEATYKQLEKAVDSREVVLVKSRLEESRRQIIKIKENRYGEAIKKGQEYVIAKKYKEAKLAYTEALELKAGDAQALKNIDIIDSLWVKECISKGEEANRKKSYVLAKSYFKEALSIKPNDPLLQNKLNLIRRDADPAIYRIEREKGDLALKTFNIEEATIAYDSALSVQPDDWYIKSQMKKVIAAEQLIEEEERDEAIYQGLLANAKSLAETATSKQDYELAIKEYKKASAMFATRKFPKRKISELTRIKERVRAN